MEVVNIFTQTPKSLIPFPHVPTKIKKEKNKQTIIVNIDIT